MITEQELHEAIAECQGQRNPSASTCMRLASFYTILDHMADEPIKGKPNVYSFANEAENVIKYQSGTEFADAIHGRDVDEIMSIMDELMSTISVLNPALYKSVLRRVAR